MVKNGKSRTSLKAMMQRKLKSAKPKPVALTVKVDDATYVRLCTLGAIQRRTNQDILREALHDYLDRVTT